MQNHVYLVHCISLDLSKPTKLVAIGGHNCGNHPRIPEISSYRGSADFYPLLSRSHSDATFAVVAAEEGVPRV